MPSCANRKPVGADPIEPHLYRHEGRDAIHHLFRVAASLDSMVVGEPQILGQLKTAYAAAKDCGAVCGWLDGLLTRAFSVAKRVRSETGIGQMAVSVSYAAVELARKIFGSLANRTIMIVGRRQDVGAGRAPPAPLRAPRTSSSPTAPTSAPSKWPRCSRARRSSTPASSACCRKWIS